MCLMARPKNNSGKCSKPSGYAYSFTPEKEKSFVKFIKGVKLPDGFISNFKNKVSDNDTNITGLQSHNCHIMMQCLLLYGLQQYLPVDVAKQIIELCLFFKQICSQTLMEDDMLKAQSKALEGGPIRPQWMYPFERYMKKLKNYVRNKAKPEGPIAEGYVAEEALTFSSHYFWDVTTKFNRPDCNVDCPPPTYQFSGVLISVSASSKLFALACGPTPTPISVNSYKVNGVRFKHGGHGGDSGGDDCPPPHHSRGALRKPNMGGGKQMETSATREYPSLIHTFFLTHTVGGVFLNPEDKALYDEMLRLQGLGSNTPTGVPYTEDEIMAIVRGGKQRGHIPGVGRVLPGQGTVIPPPSQSTHSTDIARLKKREKQLTKQVNMFMRLFRSDDKFSQMLNQFESQPEYGGGSGSGGCGDDEPGDDEDGGEDEDDS
ncbi:hypothetical protein Tco_0628249 [Tanacetum coccineum]|uniref:DUF4218 domain-containing protein n=1 Tax=Tanacetum coccineum TaxID=301880 RepID=A0ABQ4WPS4_9ASTR